MTKSALLTLYLTLFSVSIWVMFDIYKSYSNFGIPEQIEKISAPISDTIDVETLKILEKRSNR